MDYGQQLARELAETDNYSRWRAEQAAAQPQISARELRQLALVRQEMLQLAAMVFVIASLANWQTAHADKQLPCTATAFRPAISALAEKALVELGDVEACFDLLQYWQSLTARLTFAISLSDALAGPVANGVPATNATELWSDAWRRVASALLAVHRNIQAVMEKNGLVSASTHELNTLSALQSSARGGWPCVTAQGELQVPGWAERRSAQRRPANAQVLLTANGTNYKATVLDVSTTGLKFQIEGALPSGGDVSIELPDETRLVGTIAWSIANRIGVRLQAPLTEDAARMLSAMDANRDSFA